MLGLNQNAYHNFGLSGAFGGTLMDDTGKCVADATTGWADSYKYMADLKAAGAKFYTDGNALKQDFQTGKLNAVIDGPWQTADFVKALGDNLAVAPIPAGAAGPANPLTGTDGWYINPNSKSLDLAVEFALRMVATSQRADHDDRRRPHPGGPGRDHHSPIVQGFADAAAAGLPRPQRAEFNNYWGAFGDALNQVLDKGEDPHGRHRDRVQDHERGERQVAFASTHDRRGRRCGAPGLVPGPCSAVERSPIRGRYAGHTQVPGRLQEEELPGMATAVAVLPPRQKPRSWRQTAGPYLYLLPAFIVMAIITFYPLALPGLDVVHGLRPEELQRQQQGAAELHRPRQLHPDRRLASSRSRTSSSRGWSCSTCGGRSPTSSSTSSSACSSRSC